MNRWFKFKPGLNFSYFNLIHLSVQVVWIIWQRFIRPLFKHFKIIISFLHFDSFLKYPFPHPFFLFHFHFISLLFLRLHIYFLHLFFILIQLFRHWILFQVLLSFSLLILIVSQPYSSQIKIFSFRFLIVKDTNPFFILYWTQFSPNDIRIRNT